jgi:hypothetical protein
MGVQSNVADIILRWQERGRVLPQKVAQGVREAGMLALRTSKLEMSRGIYGIPEDTTKSGKKKWRRTGALRNSEQFRMTGYHMGQLENRVQRHPRASSATTKGRKTKRKGGGTSTAYAYWRHQMGKPGFRRTTRACHFRDQMNQRCGRQVFQILRRRLWEALSIRADRVSG